VPLIYGEFDNEILAFKASVGIGTQTPTSGLDVRFATTSSSVPVLIVENTSSSTTDAPAVKGTAAPADFYGIGGEFTGGWRGVMGSVSPTGSGSYFGVYGTASGGSGTNFGVYGTASGSGTNYAVYAAGDLAYTGALLNVSDQRLKQDISPIDDALDKVLQMSPQQFRYRIDEYPEMALSDGKHYGFIAQEMDTILPELVSPEAHATSHRKDTRDAAQEKLYGMNYIELIPILTRAIQEQQEIIAGQQQQIDALRIMVSDLQQAPGE
jgi:hypothetical protein